MNTKSSEKSELFVVKTIISWRYNIGVNSGKNTHKKLKKRSFDACFCVQQRKNVNLLRWLFAVMLRSVAVRKWGMADILLIKYLCKMNKLPNCERKIMEKDVETLTL